MRKAFVEAISEILDTNEKALLLIGDIGAYLLKDVTAKHPNRVINMGIAEAGMMSAAVGLALEGWIPFVYTITPFVTARAYDQIRAGVGYHEANVKIVGVGSGLSYSALGGTHHSIEDIAIMRSIPGMTIISPSDGPETIEATKSIAKHVGPTYLRLMLNVPLLEVKKRKPFKIGNAEKLSKGKDITIIATGELVREALEVKDMLVKDKISTSVINMSTIKPIDRKTIENVMDESPIIFTLEEHNIIGGLGSAVAEVISESKLKSKPRLVRLGIQDKFTNKYGHKNELYEYLNLDAKSLYKRVKKEIKNG